MAFAFCRQQAAASNSKKPITTSAIPMRKRKEMGFYKKKKSSKIQRPRCSDHSSALTSPMRPDLAHALAWLSRVTLEWELWN